MTHPLTLEKISDLSSTRLLTEDICNDMRKSADWQLEKCDDEVSHILHCLAFAGKITEEERIQTYVLFKQAMRPLD